LRPDHQEFADGAKLAAIAAISAALTAATVIGAGHALYPETEPAAAQRPELTLVIQR